MLELFPGLDYLLPSMQVLNKQRWNSFLLLLFLSFILNSLYFLIPYRENENSIAGPSAWKIKAHLIYSIAAGGPLRVSYMHICRLCSQSKAVDTHTEMFFISPMGGLILHKVAPRELWSILLGWQTDRRSRQGGIYLITRRSWPSQADVSQSHTTFFPFLFVCFLLFSLLNCYWSEPEAAAYCPGSHEPTIYRR